MLKKKNVEPNMPDGFYLACERVTGGISVIVGGIMCVTDFSPEAVMLAGHTGRISVLGKRLAMTVFENKSIEIKGRVEEIKFAYGKA